MFDWLFDGIEELMVLALNGLIAAMGAVLGTMIGLWPIPMPALPDAPEQLGLAFAWLKWGPLPVAAGLAFLLFAVTVWLAWFTITPILRWAKAADV